MFIGDSFTEGSGVAYADTFVGLVETALARQGVSVLDVLSPEYIGTVMLSPEDFAKVEHRQLWEILQGFHESGAPIDPMIVRGECKRRGLDAVALLILHLVSFTPDVPRFKHYARRVLDVSQRRQMIRAAERLVGLATDRSVSIHDSASKAADFISEIAARGFADRERTAAELFKASLRELDAGKARKRIRVGMPSCRTVCLAA